MKDDTEKLVAFPSERIVRIPVNMPFERMPECGCDPGSGERPPCSCPPPRGPDEPLQIARDEP